jgi:hypothetical protein
MSDTIGAVLHNRKHVAEAHASKPKNIGAPGPSVEEILKMNENKDLWEWVEIPDFDLFGEPYGFVSVNFDQFWPGRYFVSPEMAFEVRRLVNLRLRGDMRVLQPHKDGRMAAIMSKSLLGAPLNSDLDISQARNMKASAIF